MKACYNCENLFNCNTYKAIEIGSTKVMDSDDCNDKLLGTRMARAIASNCKQYEEIKLAEENFEIK